MTEINEKVSQFNKSRTKSYETGSQNANENLQPEEIEAVVKGKSILVKKKKKTCKFICAEYKRSFGLLFSNFAAVLILIGCFLRLWQSGMASFFMSEYFKVYP